MRSRLRTLWAEDAMGLFAEWIMVRALPVPSEGAEQKARDVVEERYAIEGLRPYAEVDGWIFARTKGHDPHELILRVRPVHAPALAGWVYDSDFAYLTGVGAASSYPPPTFSLVVGVPYTDSAEDESSRALAQLATEAGRSESAATLAAWSEGNAPKPISAGDALAVLSTEWEFAEEGLAALFDRLGLPNLEQAVFAPPPEVQGEEPDVTVSVSVDELAGIAAFRLVRRIERFGRSSEVDRSGDTISVSLGEAELLPPDVDELLAEVQAWVEEIGLRHVTVLAGGRAHSVENREPYKWLTM
jgi:hypothetical protein